MEKESNQCARISPRSDEVNGKVHETLTLAMDHDTANPELVSLKSRIFLHGNVLELRL